jgi:hypothetical protein
MWLIIMVEECLPAKACFLGATSKRYILRMSSIQFFHKKLNGSILVIKHRALDVIGTRDQMQLNRRSVFLPAPHSTVTRNFSLFWPGQRQQGPLTRSSSPGAGPRMPAAFFTFPTRVCLVPSNFSNFSSHQNIKYSKWRMYGTLNVGKQNNLLHNLDVRCEINFLSLVSP